MQFPKITIQEIVQHEIHHAKNKLQIDKHFTYYKSIMKQRNLNIFTLNESFYIPDIEEIVLNILREEFDDNYNDWLSYCV